MCNIYNIIYSSMISTLHTLHYTLHHIQKVSEQKGGVIRPATCLRMELGREKGPVGVDYTYTVLI